LLFCTIRVIYQVAKLEKTKLKISKSSNQPTKIPQNKIHSIALNFNNNGSPSPQSAHAYTMTLLFNALEDGTLMNINHLSNDGDDDDDGGGIIKPAVDIEIASGEDLRNRRIHSIMGVHGKGNTGTNTKRGIVAAKSLPKRTISGSAPKNKVTTAASFFGTVMKKANEKKDKKSKIPNNKNKDEKSFTNTTSTFSSTSTKNNSKNSRRNSSNATQQTKKSKTDKGNADDFVGDEDEDDDFEQQEKERLNRNSKNEQKQKVKERLQKNAKIVISNDVESMAMDMDIDNNEKENVEEKEVITGAIDAFATKKREKKDDDNEDGDNQRSTQKGRKRRKQVLEERTYVDESGFLRTETISAWKEVDENDDDNEVEAEPGSQQSLRNNNLNTKSSQGFSSKKKSSTAGTKPKKPKNTKGMKQQGLMGFFAAKKK
jgi:hypothetical protein